MAAHPIRLTTGENTLEASVTDSPTARDFASVRPLTLEFRHYGGQEVLADLPRALTTSDAPARSGAEPGQIAYYSPSQVLVLYYESVASFPGIIPIGQLDADPTVISSLPDGSTIAIESR